MKVAKKKVSFDIEIDVLSSIKAWCVDNKIKQSDFYRIAAIKYFDEVNQNKELYFFDNKTNKMIKLNVDLNYYDFEEYDADDEIKSAFGIKKIVLVKRRKDMEENTSIVSKLLKENDEVLKCFKK